MQLVKNKILEKSDLDIFESAQLKASRILSFNILELPTTSNVLVILVVVVKT